MPAKYFRGENGLVLFLSGQVDKSKSGIILDNNCSYGRYLQIKTTIILAKPYLVSKSE